MRIESDIIYALYTDWYNAPQPHTPPPPHPLHPLPIKAYARTHFSEKVGIFSMMKGANSRTQKGSSFRRKSVKFWKGVTILHVSACFNLFLDTESVSMFADKSWFKYKLFKNSRLSNPLMDMISKSDEIHRTMTYCTYAWFLNMFVSIQLLYLFSV